jgi:glycolate oxidase iron-sulfur subunit
MAHAAVQLESDRSGARLGTLLEENKEGLLTCIHCGLCLPACPTYRAFGNENDSPRGRVYLMRAVSEGRLGAAGSFATHIDLCLGCRACEPACPAGVPYGRLLEAAREGVAAVRKDQGSVAALLTRFVLNQVFTRPRLLAAVLAAARLVRDSGLARLAFDTELVGGRLRFALALLLASRSPVASGAKTISDPERLSLPSSHYRVAVLRGCVMEGLFAPANRATERVLEKNGCEIVEAEGQMCCGALHSHAGEADTARKLARRNIDAFPAASCDRVIVGPAGCGAAMKEYDHLLAGDPDYAGRAREFVSRVRDVSEFLVETGTVTPPGHIAKRITYDAPCHLIHAQRISTEPMEVLKAVPGIEIAPLRDSDRCCGGAGIYNLLHPDLSSAILGEKIDNIVASGAEAVVTSNPGCAMQIGAGLLLRGYPIEVVHAIELLDAAYMSNGTPVA